MRTRRVVSNVVMLQAALACLLLLPGAAASKGAQIKVSRSISCASPSEALEAFWERTWLRGGSSPLPAVHLEAWGDRTTRVGSVRSLWPMGLVERVELVEQSASAATARFQCCGLWLGGLEISHEVRFAAESDGLRDEHSPNCCELTWSVGFAPSPPQQSNQPFWRWLVEAAVIARARSHLEDLASHLETRQPERTLRVRTPLGASALAALRAWENFVWVEGGGLRLGPIPLPPPLTLSSGTRVVLPPGLVERVLDVSETELCVRYAVLNPGFFVCYPVSEHLGTVTFRAEASGCVMEWEVRLRPLRYGRALTKLVTELVVAQLAYNLSRELASRRLASGDDRNAFQRIQPVDCDWDPD